LSRLTLSGEISDDEARRLFAQNCVFVRGCADLDSLPPPSLPEVAFVGRSNCGKSSLINALLGRRALARVSNTPGRTREVNFFSLGDTLMLVDLPGYGYARAARSISAVWQDLIFNYLRGRANLRRTALLIDARRGVGELDRMAMGLLDEAAVSFALVLTKIDKLSSNELGRVTSSVAQEAKRHTAAFPEIFASSARDGLGLGPLKRQLASLTRQ